MKIEDLIELDTETLVSLANNPTELEKHFGWCISATRPTEEARLRLLEGQVKTKNKLAGKTLTPKKVQAMAKENQLEVAKKLAMETAKAMGIELKL